MTDRTEKYMEPVRMDRIARLKIKQREILSLPADQALNAILEFDEPMPLVHSFARQDFYFLVQEIGPADAQPILSLASDRQWEHLLDLEIWEKDRISGGALSDWLEILLHTDPVRLTRWLSGEKRPLFTYTLYRNITVMVREHDQDPSIFGEDCVTFDDVYYFKFNTAAGETDEKITAGADDDNDDDGERRKALLTAVLGRLAETDYEKFRQILLESTLVMPAESEEDQYRWRNVRLAESGLLPFEEAIGIYQPLGVAETEALKRRYAPQAETVSSGTGMAVTPSAVLETDSWLAKGLAAVGDEAFAETLRAEFAALCNRVIIADQRPVKDRAALGSVVGKTAGYLALGMQRVMGASAAPTPGEVAEAVRTYSLHMLFRAGYDRVVKIKQRAEKWLKHESWCEQNNLTLSFWGENWLGVLGGLLLKRPLYYDNYETGVLYRDFAMMADIERTESALDEIMGLDFLFAKSGMVLPAAGSGHFLTYKNLLLTCWVCDQLGISPPGPVPLDRFRPYFKKMFAPDGTGKISSAIKQSFLDWLIRASGLQETDIIAVSGTVFERLFVEIENEYGHVDARYLDPRYVQLFMIE